MGHRRLTPLVTILAALSFMLLLLGCKKDDDVADGPSVTDTTPVDPMAADAVLQASRLYGTPTEHTGTATFFSGDSSLSVGSVSLNGVLLEESPFFPWYYSPTPNTINLSSGIVTWNVVGGNGFPSFQRVLGSTPFSDVSPITSSLTINMSEGYTMVTTGFPGAQQVLFQVGLASKIMPAGTTICDFTAAELQTYNSPGTETISAIGLVTHTEIIDGKRFVFINRAGWQESATLL